GSAASWANVPSSQWSGTNSISFTGEDAAVNAGSSSNAGFSVNRTGTSPNNVGLSINNLVTSPINSPSDKIGLQITSTGAFGTEGGTNIGLDVNVSGGNAQNIAAQFDGGNVVVSNGELRVEETVRISNNTATNFPLFFIDGNFSGDAAMRFSSSNTFTMGVDGSDNIFKISDWTSLGTNDRLSINSTGQVGIGTSLLSTNIKMEIENTERFSLWLDNNYSGGLDNYAVFVPDMTGSGNKYAFYQSGTADENYFAGNVGIGTTTPSARLDVEASTVGYVAEITNLSTLGTPFSPDILRLNYTSTSPGGSSWAVGVFTGSTTLEGGIRMNGGTVGIFQASDRRRKEMIENTNINGLEIINSITIRDYNFIGKSERKTGFIAQELQDAYKPAVFGDPDGDVDSDPMTVSYSELIPVTIKAIQEQQDIIESLQKELESMKQKLATSEASESSLQSQLEKQSAEIEAIKKAIGLNVNAKAANHE
ncbi:MAG: tail fiber domain-containing protein, partial [Bacteroidota bacterium]